MQLGVNIARNAALRENVFMMAICVELRIPLFLVGKPGSSKSLAKSIISESMKGKDSKNGLLKQFKEVRPCLAAQEIQGGIREGYWAAIIGLALRLERRMQSSFILTANLSIISMKLIGVLFKGSPVIQSSSDHPSYDVPSLVKTLELVPVAAYFIGKPTNLSPLSM
jgi:hypothetical protein